MFNWEGGEPRNEGKDYMSPSIQSNGFQFAFSVHSGRILYMRVGCVLLPSYSTEHKAEPVGHRDPAKSCEVPGGSKPPLGFGWAGLNGWAGWKSKPHRGRAGVMGIWRVMWVRGFGVGKGSRQLENTLSWWLVCIPIHGGNRARWGWVSQQWFRKPTPKFHSPHWCENGQQHVKHSSFFQEPCWRRELMDSLLACSAAARGAQTLLCWAFLAARALFLFPKWMIYVSNHHTSRTIFANNTAVMLLSGTPLTFQFKNWLLLSDSHWNAHERVRKCCKYGYAKFFSYMTQRNIYSFYVFRWGFFCISHLQEEWFFFSSNTLHFQSLLGKHRVSCICAELPTSCHFLVSSEIPASYEDKKTTQDHTLFTLGWLFTCYKQPREEESVFP